MRKHKVAVLGATGAVGQKFIRLLEGHPFFEVAEVVASERSAGKNYREATTWLEETPLPKTVSRLELKTTDAKLQSEICFSALPGGEAGPVERALAKQGKKVFTNARDLRMATDVPLVIAEVNGDHLRLVKKQRRDNKSDGYVVANGNCTAIVLSMALKPLLDEFGLRQCHVVTMQALSGAGYPGVPSLDITDNLVPYIGGEEDKVESEPLKFLGRLGKNKIELARFRIGATCTRVAVIEGHTEAVSVKLQKDADAKDILAAWRSFRGIPEVRRLPSAPKQPIIVRKEQDRPQPRRDRAAGDFMSVTVGRLRPDPLLGWKFLVTGSNTVRGAAGGSILNAELAAAMDLL